MNTENKTLPPFLFVMVDEMKADVEALKQRVGAIEKALDDLARTRVKRQRLKLLGAFLLVAYIVTVVLLNGWIGW